MSEDRRAKIDDDPVCRRIARILDAKRRENEEVLGALKAVDDAWEGLNKEVDATIGTEFDLMEAEREAVLAAKKRLDKPRTEPVDEGFVLGGKVRDVEKKAGLPGVLVRLVREKDGEEEVLAETLTDQMGNFALLVPKAKLRAPTARRGGERLRIEALSKAGERPLFTLKKSLVLEAGKVEEVELKVPSGPKIEDRLTAAETVRDSVEESLQVVERRITSMKAAHTAVSRFAGLTRDGLKALREELAVEPPEIVAAVPVAGIEPEPSPGGAPSPPEPAPEPAPPEPRPTPRPVLPRRPTPAEPPRLEDINGIGPARAKKLRSAGIVDVQDFIEADNRVLKRILGDLDIKEMKILARKLLREFRG